MKYTLLLLIFINIYCNIETNTADPRSSKDIDFSKWNGSFLEEYFVQSTTGQLFSVGEAWVEKVWRNNSDGSVHLTPTGVSRLVIQVHNKAEIESKLGMYSLNWVLICCHTMVRFFSGISRFRGMPFTLDNLLSFIAGLFNSERVEAVNYVRQAPSQIGTRNRNFIEQPPKWIN